ncbi:hypothetical protein [Paenibacillus fonticola]|nr:hypothetical protein [Paenibacillus fonticola]
MTGSFANEEPKEVGDMGHLVEENLTTVRQQMELACQASGRNIKDV